MFEAINALLNYEFMQYALAACILASIGCGIIGTFVVVRRVGFMAGGIAHTVLAGMGIAYFMGASPMLGAVIMALVSAVLIGLIKLYWKQDEDIVIAAFWSVGMAVGILFISRTPGYNIDLMSYLFGNILLVSSRDLLFMLILDIAIVLTVIFFYKQLLATAFDEEFAALRGVQVELVYILTLCMIALTVVLLISIVGLILVMALLILPAASAAQFAGSVYRMIVMSIMLSTLITIAGLLISYQPDLPAGSTIIVLAGLVYLLSILLRMYITKSRKKQSAAGEVTPG